MKKLIFTLMLLCAWANVAQAEFPSSFNAAKGKMWQVYKDNRFDQYCGCPLGSRNAPDLKACGYEARKNLSRASRSEAEHVVPAENLGRQFACWRQGGRDFCNASDPAFRNAHNDLHNLIPVVGEVNGDRSNFRFDELSQGYGQYGQCQFKVDFASRRAEPPPEMKGDIARIHYYMRDAHGLRLSDAQVRLFNAWSKMDPVSEWELIRDQRIERLQGTSNPYVSGKSLLSAPNEHVFSAPVNITTPLAKADQGGEYDCARSTCGAMNSCAQARHKLLSCGHKSLDRDGDGVPCEALCK